VERRRFDGPLPAYFTHVGVLVIEPEGDGEPDLEVRSLCLDRPHDLSAHLQVGFERTGVFLKILAQIGRAHV